MSRTQKARPKAARRSAETAPSITAAPVVARDSISPAPNPAREEREAREKRLAQIARTRRDATVEEAHNWQIVTALLTDASSRGHDLMNLDGGLIEFRPHTTAELQKVTAEVRSIHTAVEFLLRSLEVQLALAERADADIDAGKLHSAGADAVERLWQHGVIVTAHDYNVEIDHAGYPHLIESCAECREHHAKPRSEWNCESQRSGELV